jgi:hypothetical protein
MKTDVCVISVSTFAIDSRNEVECQQTKKKASINA